MNWIIAVAPVVLRLLGLSTAAPTVLKYLPLIIKYAPLAESIVKTAIASWQSLETSYPALADGIRAIAAKLTPTLPAKEGNLLTLKAILTPHKMTPAEEKIWMERGMTPPNATNDFPQGPI